MMGQPSARPLLKLARKIRIARGSVGYRQPVRTHDALYLGHERQEIVKLSWDRLDTLWRIPANGFNAWFPFGELLLLQSSRTVQARAIHPNGEVAWLLDTKGRWGWGPVEGQAS